MADLPLNHHEKATSTADVKAVQSNQIEVTPGNAAVLTVHFLSVIYGRLGYIVKLLEEKK